MGLTPGPAPTGADRGVQQQTHQTHPPTLSAAHHTSRRRHRMRAAAKGRSAAGSAFLFRTHTHTHNTPRSLTRALSVSLSILSVACTRRRPSFIRFVSETAPHLLPSFIHHHHHRPFRSHTRPTLCLTQTPCVDTPTIIWISHSLVAPGCCTSPCAYAYSHPHIPPPVVKDWILRSLRRRKRSRASEHTRSFGIRGSPGFVHVNNLETRLWFFGSL